MARTSHCKSVAILRLACTGPVAQDGGDELVGVAAEDEQRMAADGTCAAESSRESCYFLSFSAR